MHSFRQMWMLFWKISTGEGSDTAIVTSKVWVNADGKIVGRRNKYRR